MRHSRFHPDYQFTDSHPTPSAHPVEKRFSAFLQVKGELLDPLGNEKTVISGKIVFSVQGKPVISN